MKRLLAFLLPLAFLCFSCTQDNGVQPVMEQSQNLKLDKLDPPIEWSVNIHAINIRYENPEAWQWDVQCNITPNLHLPGAQYDVYLWWSDVNQWYGPFPKTSRDPTLLGGDAMYGVYAKEYIVVRWNGETKTSNTITISYIGP